MVDKRTIWQEWKVFWELQPEKRRRTEDDSESGESRTHTIPNWMWKDHGDPLRREKREGRFQMKEGNRREREGDHKGLPGGNDEELKIFGRQSFYLRERWTLTNYEWEKSRVVDAILGGRGRDFERTRLLGRLGNPRESDWREKIL